MATKMTDCVSIYVQAIPLYFASDVNVSRYFKEFRDDIDAITGMNVQVLEGEEVRNNDAEGIVVAVRDLEKGRFSGIKVSDIPCLCIEDGCGQKKIIKLPHEFDELSQILRILSDACQETKEAEKIVNLVHSRRSSDLIERTAWLQILKKELPVRKSTEKLIAIVFGVVFVVATFVVAIFIPEPTPFQYTIFRIVLALAASGFVSMTPGFLEVQVSNYIRAGGALGVFVVVFFFSPAALVVSQ